MRNRGLTTFSSIFDVVDVYVIRFIHNFLSHNTVKNCEQKIIILLLRSFDIFLNLKYFTLHIVPIKEVQTVPYYILQGNKSKRKNT